MMSKITWNRINLSNEFEVNSEDFPVIQYVIDTGHFKLIAERGKDKLIMCILLII